MLWASDFHPTTLCRRIGPTAEGLCACIAIEVTPVAQEGATASSFVVVWSFEPTLLPNPFLLHFPPKLLEGSHTPIVRVSGDMHTEVLLTLIFQAGLQGGVSGCSCL